MDQLKVIDFGCGTGLVGKQLKARGVKSLTGLDCSKAMLEIAQKKGVYSTLQNILLGGEDYVQELPINFRNKFDFVTASGLIDVGVQDEELFEQMLLPLKEGGVFVFSAQFSYLGDFWWVDKLEQLEKLGRIRKIYSNETFRYGNLKESIGRFGKQPIRILAY